MPFLLLCFCSCHSPGLEEWKEQCLKPDRSDYASCLQLPPASHKLPVFSLSEVMLSEYVFFLFFFFFLLKVPSIWSPLGNALLLGWWLSCSGVLSCLKLSWNFRCRCSSSQGAYKHHLYHFYTPTAPHHTHLGLNPGAIYH